MKELKRYTLCEECRQMEEDEEGGYVRYSDYEVLQKKFNDVLKKLNDALAHISALERESRY